MSVVPTRYYDQADRLRDRIAQERAEDSPNLDAIEAWQQRIDLLLEKARRRELEADAGHYQYDDPQQSTRRSVSPVKDDPAPTPSPSASKSGERATEDRGEDPQERREPYPDEDIGEPVGGYDVDYEAMPASVAGVPMYALGGLLLVMLMFRGGR